MSSLSGFLSETISALGQTFIMAYYLPAALFLLVQVQVFVPIWTDLGTSPVQTVQALPTNQDAAEVTPPAAPEAAPQSPTEPASAVDAASPTNPDWLASLGEGLVSLLIFLVTPFLIGIVLFGLNDLLIVGFEGKLPWLRDGLLAWWTRRNRKRSGDLYGDLLEPRTEYVNLQVQLEQTTSPQERRRLEQLLNGLVQQIDQTNKVIEAAEPVQSLPHAAFRIGPNRFGNAYAMAEEYAYERYGVDAVLFWGRLRTLMEDRVPTLTVQLIQQKTLIDQSLNLSFLAGLVLLEGVIASIALAVMGSRANYVLTLLVLLASSAVLAVCFYYVAVGRVEVMGELIKQSFDYHRQLVLESFGLKRPASLAAERRLWMQLAAFIRRGDDFYFPAEYQTDSSSAQPEPEQPAQTAER